MNLTNSKKIRQDSELTNDQLEVWHFKSVLTMKIVYLSIGL